MENARAPLLQPAASPFYEEVVAGLSRAQKTLPCKYFYDARGSQLFEQICGLEEYYVTRTEIGILQTHLPEMTECIGTHARIIEFGTGEGIKTERLLDALDSPAAYLPVDISQSALAGAAARLAQRFPRLAITPLCADYTQSPLDDRLAREGEFTVFFPGSTLGNFERAEACAFLRRMRRLTGRGGGILIGVDVMKSPSILIPAYDDAKGITAAFNKNLLLRINRELAGDFDVEAFSHRAAVNWEKSRVEMHLVSRARQIAHVMGLPFYFLPGESIHTENSHKYSLPAFQALAAEAGLAVRRTWTDRAGLYSMHYLQALPD